MPPLGNRTNSHAAKLRAAQTTAERTLWFAVRDRRLDGFKIRRQVSVGAYVVDFLCVEARLVIELDGGQHTPEIDAERTNAIQASGYDILRFWNNDILGNLDGVLTVLLCTLRARALTQPSPRGRGL